MQGVWNVAKVQAGRLIKRNEFWLSIALGTGLFSIAFAELCVHFIGADKGAIPSAATAWIANMDSLLVFSMHLYFFLVIPLLSSMTFGDALFIDSASRQVDHILTRCSVRTYIAATAVVAFAAGFCSIAIPMVLSQLLSLIVFPVSSEPWAFSGNILSTLQDYSWIRSRASGALFYDLMYEMPYAYNCIFILYDSIWGGLSAVVSVAVSCYTRKSRLLVVGAPTFLFMMAFFLFRGVLPLQYYLYPNTLYLPLSPAFFFLAPVLVGVVSVGMLAERSSKGGDLFL